MNDGIIKGDGTSRKVFANLPATYEEFRMQAASGALAMDILFNAAGWQQLPDFLNRQNLLQGATAAMYSLDPDDGVPDSALRVIGRLNKGVGNECLWEKRGTEYVPVTSEEGMGGILLAGDTVTYSPFISYNEETESFSLDFPASITLNLAGNYSFLSGMYITLKQPFIDGKVLKCTSFEPGGAAMFNYSALEVTAQKKTGLLGYVNSPDPDAYPPKESDGFTYIKVGRVGAFARTITGSYTGTGEATKSLTFPVLPQFLIIYKSNITIGQGVAYTIWAPYLDSVDPNVSGQSFIKTEFSTVGTILTLTGNAGGLGEDEDATLAMNTKDAKYYYFAVLG